MLLMAYTAVATRLHEIKERAADDRGDSPVSTAIIVAVLATAAVAIAGVIAAAASSWAAKIPK